MNPESYIVSYFHGTSGSFIAHLIWLMINRCDEAIPMTNDNSVHPFDSPWNGSWTHDKYDNPNITNTKEIYDSLVFINKGLVLTHTYPDYDIIETQLPNTKTIVISIDPADFKEIAFNCITKTDIVDKSMKKLEDAFSNLYSIKDYEMLDQFYSFCDTNIIPKHLTDKVLVLKYRDIYEEVGESYLAIEKIKEFIQYDILPNTLNSYKQYVKKRNETYGTN